MYYTGIGSRNTPHDVLLILHKVAADLVVRGYTLRSGGATGADSAFEQGCGDGKKEIYLPWKGYNDNDSELFNISDAAYDIAEEIYGARWRNISIGVRKLMARNMHQISGQSLDLRSQFVVCWTPDGCNSKSTRTQNTGGTGQAIAYADSLAIPIFNIKNEVDMGRLMAYTETLGAIEW